MSVSVTHTHKHTQIKRKDGARAHAVGPAMIQRAVLSRGLLWATVDALVVRNSPPAALLLPAFPPEVLPRANTALLRAATPSAVFLDLILATCPAPTRW